MSDQNPSRPSLPCACRGTVRTRSLPPGSGFAIGGTFGALGLATALVLWNAGAPLWVVLLVYMTLPGALLAALFLATRPLQPRTRVRSLREENRHV
ncbi:hypothetical protein LCM08_18405 [Salipiger pacificus]|uniref:Uncharacterized protein n=1 Tax=Alloyangia mangrovi TaxID=1779329 RepID=A0A2A3K1C3_9RHOB|nr:hypothetical protein [Alloyangia pacifica]MCA0946896.1 hypothetical protein [Alloyangia pacifica]